MTETRTRVLGDDPPGDVREVVDAYGDRYWRTGGGWRSSRMAFEAPDRTWWWLTAYRSPLKER